MLTRFMYRLGMPQDPHMRTMHGWIELVLEGHETTQLQGRALHRVLKQVIYLENSLLSNEAKKTENMFSQG